MTVSAVALSERPSLCWLIHHACGKLHPIRSLSRPPVVVFFNAELLMSQLHRRPFLKATGIAIGLPLMESMAAAAPQPESAPAKRLVCVGTYLGFYQKSFFPKQTGFDYETPELLEPLQALRDDFSVFSGLDHRAGNGHGNWSTFLTGQKLNQVSLDQLVAPHIGQSTRFESVQISAGKVSRPMNFSREGVPLPVIERPSLVYKKLFASQGDRARIEYLIASGQSALDKVRDEATELRRRVSRTDQQKLDEYFASLRDVEKRLQKQQANAGKTANVDYELPEFDPLAPTLMLECEKIMYDLMALALQTDSTRVITMNIGGLGQVFEFDGRILRAGYHALSHHGNDPEKIRDLVRVEVEHIRCMAAFLAQLKTKTDASGKPLLDSTLVLLGTGMGDSSRHANRNLPTLVAGGGLRHGQHVAADSGGKQKFLLGDLYITLMQQLGVEQDSFSNASRNMNEQLMS